MYIERVNMSVKFCFEIPSDCWENCKKILGGYLSAAPWEPTFLFPQLSISHQGGNAIAFLSTFAFVKTPLQSYLA